MASAVGFTLTYQIAPESLAASVSAQRQALSHFPWLDSSCLIVGDSRLDLWGHKPLSERTHRLPDGGLLALIGSPMGDISWDEVEKPLAKAPHPEDFALPWEGRAVLLKIRADGRHWTMWNDWVGSIPVFHARAGSGWIASTLESAVVAAAGYTPHDLSLPGVLSLLINGHYLGEGTLFKGMKVAAPDCAAEWNEDEFRWKRLGTVKPSAERWDRGWDELTDEMHALSRQAIADVLKTQSSWALPLSGGLDSRLMAAVAEELGVNVRAYTYGRPTREDALYARQVARALRLPWKCVDLGTDYLTKYTKVWADWFGSALHFHGMYQMPFLQDLMAEQPGPVLNGYLGETLAGYHLRSLAATHSGGSGGKPLMNRSFHWLPEELKHLFKFPIEEALEELRAQTEREINAVEGARFQRLVALDLWNRQRLFIYYQPTMYDYWGGVATPFLNRSYARFCLSLPRLALEQRRLLGAVFRRYYPTVAAIPGTYAANPLRVTGRYMFKERLAHWLPKGLRRGPLREFNPLLDMPDQECIRAAGGAALWPIQEAWNDLRDWFDMSQLTALLKAAQGGDMRTIKRLQSVQTLAYRLLR